jgi:L-lactate dehydrogenase (cytochrome)
VRPIFSVDEARLRARRRLPRMVFDFVDGAAEDEVTMQANRGAFASIALRPRRLVDVSERDQSTTVLGTPIAMPVLLAPTGLSRLVSRHGEPAVARAAGANGTVYTLSTMASASLEEVAAAATGPLWFQLYPWNDEQLVKALVRRAQDLGYGALVVAVDTPLVGKRERDARNGFTIPPRFGPRTAVDIIRHPRWLRDGLAARSIGFANLGAAANTSVVSAAKFVNENLVNPSADIRYLDELRRLWRGPLVVKGLMTGEDARRAVDAGADAVVVSNHGGRQLDGEPATVTVLSEVISAVGREAEVYIDGGIRRGTDVLKCIALGARACFVGRPYLYGLAAGGEQGVGEILRILHAEIDAGLALLGRPRLSDVGIDAVRLPA